MRRNLLLILVLVAAAAGCSRGMKPRSVVPGEILEFGVPWDGAFPSDIAIDSTGKVWFTDRITHTIGRFDPDSRRFKRFKPPTKLSAPYGMITAPDGSIWFAESKAGRLARLDPKTGDIVEHVIPNATGGPQVIALHDGRIWFSLRDARRYGWYEPATGKSEITEAPFMKPYGVTIASDGTVWMSSHDGWILLRIDAQGADTVSLPAAPRMARYSMRRIAADSSGHIWLSDFNSGIIRFTPATGELQPYIAPLGIKGAYGITVDPDDNVWYYSPAWDGVVHLNTATGQARTRAATTRNASVRQIAIDWKRGRVWLPMSDKGLIGLIFLRK